MNSSLSTLAALGTISLGFNAVHTATEVRQAVKQERINSSSNMMNQRILSASAIVKQLMCESQTISIIGNTITSKSPKHQVRSKNLYVSLHQPKESSDFDAIFQDSFQAMESTNEEVQFKMLKQDSTNGVVFEASTITSDRTKVAKVKIDCPSTEASGTSDTLEDSSLDITKVALGISFEDGQDGDFNDMILCLKGKFAVDVDKKIVRSLEQQKIEVLFKRNTGISNHVMKVVDGEDGKQLLQVPYLRYGQTKKKTITFQKDQLLDVSLKTWMYRNPIGINHHTAKVELDTCRTEGV